MKRRNTAQKGQAVGRQHRFATIPHANIPRSKFNRSRRLTTTCDASFIVPIFVDEALPGDTFQLSANFLVRLATPLKPIFENIKATVYYFAAPKRILWEHWTNFMGEQDDPDDTTQYLPPTTDDGSLGMQAGTLWDYFGLPVGRSPGENPTPITVNAFHHRMYNKMWNQFFRDENLLDRVPENYDDGPDPAADYTYTSPIDGVTTEFLLRAGKRHDYFTSALPWPQKGPSVELPLGESAMIAGWADVQSNQANGGNGIPTLNAPNMTASPFVARSGFDYPQWDNTPTTPNDDAFWGDPALGTDGTGLYADLSTATAATINQIRLAFQIQKLYEKDARGGHALPGADQQSLQGLESRCTRPAL